MQNAQTYHKGNWKAEVSVEELASGKYQGIVSLLREDRPSSEQIERRTVDVSDTFDGALEEAKVLAQHVLGTMH
jgi:hypothetical protein